MSQITTTKKIIAITTISLGAASFANAQVPQNNISTPNFGTKIMQNLTDAQKAILEQAKSLFQSGKKEEAKTLLEQNNLQPKHFGKKMKGGHGKNENHQAVHEAIEAGDYAKFVQVASSSPMAKVNQNTFNSLVPHFQAMKNARTNIENILKAAGIEKPTRPGNK